MITDSTHLVYKSMVLHESQITMGEKNIRRINETPKGKNQP